MLKVAVATHYPTPVPRLHKYAAILESRGFKFVWDVPPTLANPYVYALTHALRLPPECDIALGFGHDGMLAVSKFPGPIIYDYPDPFYGEDRPTNPLSSGLAKIFSRLEARLVRRASFVCTSSRMQSEYLIAKHDLPPSRVPFFWNSVDPHQFHRINKSDLGIEGLDGWTGVYLGQLAQGYGLSMALESWHGDHLLIVSKYRDPNRARILIEKGKRRGLDVRV